MDPHAPLTLAELKPLLVALCLTMVALTCALAALGWQLVHRMRRRARAEAEWQRRAAVRQQLLDMQRQILLEQASAEERAWQQRYEERRAAVRREARRRLGLPEEGPED